MTILSSVTVVNDEHNKGLLDSGVSKLSEATPSVWDYPAALSQVSCIYDGARKRSDLLHRASDATRPRAPSTPTWPTQLHATEHSGSQGRTRDTGRDQGQGKKSLPPALTPKGRQQSS